MITGIDYFENGPYKNCIVCGKKQNDTYWTCSPSDNDHLKTLQKFQMPDYIPDEQKERYIIEYFKKEKNNEKLE